MGRSLVTIRSGIILLGRRIDVLNLLILNMTGKDGIFVNITFYINTRIKNLSDSA